MTQPYRPKKYLGQNFLIDQRVQQKIIAGCQFRADDIAVEIGPGKGAITRLAAPYVQRLICVESDQDLIAPLEKEFQGAHVEIIHADFLKWGMVLPGKVKVLGNIPYYISTPIIEKLIENRRNITSAYLTVQVEFGSRLAAQPGSKEYGALTCFAQYYADVKVLFKIKNTCFYPVPKVDSCFVRMDFLKIRIRQPKDEAMMFRVIRAAFTQRRKNILNALSPLIEKERLSVILEEAGIPSRARPEELNLDNFIAISDHLV